MLEQLRQQSRSFIIWVLFGIIIAAFVLFFGPQAGPDMLACGASHQSTASVEGHEISAHSWRYAMNGLGFGSGGGPQAYSNRHQAIDQLVERELLAIAAEEKGFNVSDELVNEQLTNGTFYILGYRQDGTRTYFRNGVFDYELLERTAQNLGLPSVAHFIEEQRRELMAESMRDLLLSSAQVSEEEARATYIHQNTTVSVDYVKFDVADYAAAMKLGEEALEAYASEHEDEIKQKWETDKARYTKDQPWVLARHVFIKKKAASGETEGEEGEAPAAAPGEIAAKARARIEGGEALSAVALELSDDDRSKYRGGSLGWRPAESLGFGKELVEAAKELKAGAVSEVIETQNGFHVLKVDERHEGPLTLEKKRLDLAAALAPEYYGRQLARRDAEEALARAKEQPLDELFERKSTPSPGGMPGMGGPGAPSLTPEQQEQLQRQIEEAMKSGAAQGAAPAEGGAPESEPAAEEPEAPGAAAGAPAEKSPPKKAPPEKKTPPRNAPPKKAPKEAPASGEAPAEEAPAGGGTSDAPQGALHGRVLFEGPNVLAQAGGAPVEVSEPEAEPADPEAALPEPVGLEAPKLESVGPVPRSDFFAGIGRSEELAKDLFEKVEVGQLADKVYEVEESEGFAIVKLTAREDADLEDFEDEKEQIIQSLEFQKGFTALFGWIQRRCDEVTKSGEVRVSPAFLEPDDDDEATGPKEYPYQPCKFITETGMQRKLLDRMMPYFGL